MLFSEHQVLHFDSSRLIHLNAPAMECRSPRPLDTRLRSANVASVASGGVDELCAADSTTGRGRFGEPG